MKNLILKSLWLSLALVTTQLWAANPDYKTEYRYNLARQVTGVILPDPDGDGPLNFQATRNTYNAQGLLSKVEQGELASRPLKTTLPSVWSGFTINTSQTFTYDIWGRKLTEKHKNDNGDIQYIKQYKYDLLGRVECKMVRMTDTLASNACAADENVHGYDRITKYTYNNHNDITLIQKAYDTPIQQDYATYTYWAAGLKKGVADASGNYAQLEYDDYARLSKWIFPSKLTAGSLNTADFEQYGYDANGNRTSLKKRDGKTITFEYDNLNQLTKKDLPTTSAGDVYYGYDLRGLQLYSRFASATGIGITNIYDGFGNIKKASNKMGSYTRDLLYQYDKNGNRTRITYPGGSSINLGHDGLNRLDSVTKHGGSILLTQTYNSAGSRAGISRYNGVTSSSFTYSGSRLESLGHDLLANSADIINTYTYNPANQVVSMTLSNSLYQYQGNDNITGDYVVNGLNQYTSAGGKTLKHDDNSNMTSDGETTYVYDVENRLISASGAKSATLTYDPMGRLFSVTGGGTTTEFLYDGDTLIAEYNSSNVMQRRYVHGSGVDEPLIWYEGSGMTDAEARFLHVDHQGSIVAITDVAGNELQINTYDAYGIAADDILGRFAYTGQMYLQELDLYHYKARVYHPQLGRFLQTDPVGYEDQMNLYAYVGNDPVNMVDPTGEWIQLAAALVGGVIGGAAEYLTNPNATMGDIARATAVGAGVGFVSSMGGGVISSALLGGGANASGEMINQIATGNYDGAKVATAGLTGLVGGAAGKLAGDKVVSTLNKGLPDNSVSNATHNMTSSTSQRVLAGSQSMTNATQKAAVAEFQVGAGYGAGAAAGMAAAEQATGRCTDYDSQAGSKGC